MTKKTIRISAIKAMIVAIFTISSPFLNTLTCVNYAVCVAAFWCSWYFASKLARIFLEISTTITTMTPIAMSPGRNPAATCPVVTIVPI